MRRIRITVTELLPNGQLVRHQAWQAISEAKYQHELRRAKATKESK